MKYMLSILGKTTVLGKPTMDDEKSVKRIPIKLGIATKISLICSLVVLTCLFISNVVFFKLESNLVTSIIDDNVAATEKRIQEEGAIQKKALDERMQINTEICATIASSFLYNINSDGLKLSLQPFMSMPEMLGIVVTDYVDQPFFAFWRDKDGVKSGSEIPTGITLNGALTDSLESNYQNEKVGKVTLYMTDAILKERLTKNQEEANTQVTAFRVETNKELNHTIITQVIVVLGVVVVLITTIMLSLKVIAINPIRAIIERIKDIAEGEGDLTARLNVKSNDEMSELARWFNAFIEKLQSMIAKVTNNASHLTTSSRQLAEISDLMSEGASQSSNKAMTVAAASEQMNTMISSAATIMEETVNNLSIVAASAEEMTATINEIAENTETGRQIADNAVGQTNCASGQIEELGQAAQQIGKVVETITEISEQVNLLALNATIEAARAGEAGRGFAVVANEIKDLAKQTAAATDEIKQQVEGIQTSTQGTVEKISDIAKVVGEVNDIVTTIATAVEEQSVTTQDIANNVAQASKGVSKTNEGISEGAAAANNITTDIAEVTQTASEITNSSTQVNANSKELSQLAEELNNLVGQFKV